jgi:hypothetical protein
MKEIIPTIAVYIVLVILAVMTIIGGYNILSVLLDSVFGIESCNYRMNKEVCSTFDAERFVNALAMLIVSIPSLTTLFLLRKKV